MMLKLSLTIKRNLIIAVCLIATLSIVCSNGNEIKFEKPVENGPGKFSIKTEFSDYVLGQKVWIRATFKNNSDSIIFLKENFGFIGIRLNIFDPNNLELGNSLHVNIIYTDSVKFIPGEMREVIFPIDNYLSHFNNIEGVYRLQAVFQNTYSNVILFNMQPPGYDLVIQHELFMKLTNIREIII